MTTSKLASSDGEIEKHAEPMQAVKLSLEQRMRHWIKRLPFANDLYDFCTTVFMPDYAEDGMRLSKNCSFLKSPDFVAGYDALLAQEPGTKTRWRAHVSQWAAWHAVKIEGDFVETGVNKAAFSASLIRYVDFKQLTHKKFYLFDTFAGLVPELVRAEERAAYKNEYGDTYEFVRQTFADCNNVHVIRGVVPDILHTVEFGKVAYLSVDMNCAEPERAALEFFWPKMSSGGIILLDDFCFSGREPQRESADEFARSVGTRVLALPTGQGLILKP